MTNPQTTITNALLGFIAGQLAVISVLLSLIMKKVGAQ